MRLLEEMSVLIAVDAGDPECFLRFRRRRTRLALLSIWSRSDSVDTPSLVHRRSRVIRAWSLILLK